jgi:hypothetical protein
VKKPQNDMQKGKLAAAKEANTIKAHRENHERKREKKELNKEKDRICLPSTLLVSSQGTAAWDGTFRLNT